jgi:DNA-binding response OmpR family regulator
MSEIEIFRHTSQQAQRILVVEDDPEMRQLIAKKMGNVGYDVLVASSGEIALSVIAQHGLPHLAIVDINMPGMSGLEFCEAVQQYSDFPVIMVTAVKDVETTIKAIEKYAEDYVIKPFNLSELVARVQRVLRRIGDFSYTTGAQLKVDDYLTVSFAQKRVLIDGLPVELTPTETKLLYILWRNTGRVVTNQFLLGRVWSDQDVYEDTLRVHMHRLRQKVTSAQGKHQYIVTERGQGYRFVVNQKTEEAGR